MVLVGILLSFLTDFLLLFFTLTADLNEGVLRDFFKEDFCWKFLPDFLDLSAAKRDFFSDFAADFLGGKITTFF